LWWWSWLRNNAFCLNRRVKNVSIWCHLSDSIFFWNSCLGGFIEVFQIDNNLGFFLTFLWTHSKPFWAVYTRNRHTLFDRLSVYYFLARGLIINCSCWLRGYRNRLWCHLNRLIISCSRVWSLNVSNLASLYASIVW